MITSTSKSMPVPGAYSIVWSTFIGARSSKQHIARQRRGRGLASKAKTCSSGGKDKSRPLVCRQHIMLLLPIKSRRSIGRSLCWGFLLLLFWRIQEQLLKVRSGSFSTFARVPNWTGVPQQPEVLSAHRHFGVAAGAIIYREPGEFLISTQS